MGHVAKSVRFCSFANYTVIGDPCKLNLKLFNLTNCVKCFKQLESLGRSELASRLTLNCLDSYVEPQKLHGIPTTIIDVSNYNAIVQSVQHVYMNICTQKQ